MPGETDGIEEAFEGTLRVAVTAAARIGEQLARAREQYLVRARAQGEQAARDYAARLEAERAAARAELAVVYRAEWWDRAGVDDIARAYTTAAPRLVADSEARWRFQMLSQAYETVPFSRASQSPPSSD